MANLPVRVAVRAHYGTAGHAFGYSSGTEQRVLCGAHWVPEGYACTILGNASQGLELLVTVLLARNRQPPPMFAAGGPHAELAAELTSLPSGLLAMVCEAIVKLKVSLRAACACV